MLVSILSCSPEPDTTGRQLAEQYCQGCHLLPDPTDLTKNTWEFEVLPLMAARLGHRAGKLSEIENLRKMNLFPDTTTLTAEEWLKLKNYFISAAPAFAVPSKDLMKIASYIEGFQASTPSFQSESPFISLVHFDADNGQFFYGDAINKSLNVFKIADDQHYSIELNGSPSHLTVRAEGWYVLTMGKVMPHNQKSGNLVFLPKNKQGEWGEPQTWIDDLQRPVHASMGDLDGDGREDMVVASFGNYRGELAWYSDIASPQRKKHILRPLPGAIKSVITDFNRDGRPDIIALMAQGDEGFFLYLNQGNGSFQEQALMRFPPSYGSTYFEWIDMDKDGLQDILYVNGDNGDYLPIVKNFHGIRLFRNQGDRTFEEVFFLEHHGAFKAKAEDFDEDGDLDIAAISYFPDYENRPEESFVYYENKGNFAFQASTFEQQPSGKWLTMETGDIDEDGDIDIALGSAMFMTSEVPSPFRRNWRTRTGGLLILENKLR